MPIKELKAKQTKEKMPEKENTLVIYNVSGQKIEEIKSPFGGKVNHPVLTETIKMYLANQRKGLASTKTIGEVSGGGKKPWKQKGTGRARAGSIRSPLWRHGGVVFGPHPRDFSYTLSPKIKKLALLSALIEKSEHKVVVLEEIPSDKIAKTKDIQKILNFLKSGSKALIVLKSKDNAIRRASRNIPGLVIQEAGCLNALDVMKSSKVIILKDALSILKHRVQI